MTDYSKIYLSDVIDYSDLNNPVYKPYVFYMGGDGVLKTLKNGMSKIYETLLYIGFSHDYLHK